MGGAWVVGGVCGVDGGDCGVGGAWVVGGD